ncbi:MAG: histidine kinase dimerization/phosphoacceptor domain -containing protein, partial [Cyanobacteriota bacterium]|nr:histidine kinase dimerization/phosphoacceptor domain -containing protein [Cyanobacteriota bacterium]
ILAVFLARTIARPIHCLKTATQEFSAGNLQARSAVLSKDEVGELAIAYNQMAERILKAFKKEQKSLKEKYQLNSSLRKQVAIRQESEKQLKKLLLEKEVLVKEIHHRVKNNLLIVCNLLEFQAESINNEQLTQALEESRNRIYSMALIHEKLYGSNNLAQIDFAEYIEQLVDYLSETYNDTNSNIKVDLKLQPIFLSIETVNPCGLIINELISNAFKHAFPDGQEGKIEVKLQTLEQMDKIVLTIADNGVGLPPNLNFQNLDSLGMQLVETLTTQLEGNLEVIRENGTMFKLTFSELKYKQQDQLIDF